MPEVRPPPGPVTEMAAREVPPPEPRCLEYPGRGFLILLAAGYLGSALLAIAIRFWRPSSPLGGIPVHARDFPAPLRIAAAMEGLSFCQTGRIRAPLP